MGQRLTEVLMMGGHRGWRCQGVNLFRRILNQQNSVRGMLDNQ